MPGIEELLKPVLDHPDDDAPRLAYAEWCAAQPDEATRARAELIRTQVAIKRIPLEEFRRGAGYVEQMRVYELLDRYGSEWGEPLRGLADSYEFQRGFVGLVRLPARRFLDNADRLFAIAPIQHVDLTGIRDVSEELFYSPHVQRLRSLAMDRCGLFDIHIQILADSPVAAGLRWISVKHNHLSIKAAEALARSEHLKKLGRVEFLGNPVDPGEQLGWESGEVVASWLPKEGQQLESAFGILPWLHAFDGASRFD